MRVLATLTHFFQENRSLMIARYLSRAGELRYVILTMTNSMKLWVFRVEVFAVVSILVVLVNVAPREHREFA